MKPFGKSLLLDLYNCSEGIADDLEANYRFLEELVDSLGMTKMAPPYVIHGPRDKGKEIFKDKEGISGWIPLIESGIQIHTIAPKNFISIDIYTCGELDMIKILDAIKERYIPSHIESTLIERGAQYNL